jgi:hypothetical protein
LGDATLLVLFGYYFRKGLRRGWYAFWTGEENPDFEALEKKWWGEEK